MVIPICWRFISGVNDFGHWWPYQLEEKLKDWKKNKTWFCPTATKPITDEDGNTKVVGDADYDSCEKVAGWITPVPGGVGPVTVAILMRNSVVAAIRQKEHYEARFGTEPVGSQTQKLANSE